MRQGRLYKNTSGRYQLENDTYYWTSGDAMQVYDNDLGEWLQGRVEYGDIDYYWTNDKDTKCLFNGMIVRIDD